MSEYINTVQTLKLLGDISPNSLAQKPYKDYITSKGYGKYLKKEVDDFLDIRETQHWFLVQVQRLVMFIITESRDNKGEVANKLGFKNIILLNTFLEAETSSKTAKVAVKAWNKYRVYFKALELFEKGIEYKIGKTMLGDEYIKELK